jgi:hypothetical protein
MSKIIVKLAPPNREYVPLFISSDEDIEKIKTRRFHLPKNQIILGVLK